MTSNLTLPVNTTGPMISFDGVMLSVDRIIEDDETFFLSLPNQDEVPYTIGANSTVDITILNIDSESIMNHACVQVLVNVPNLTCSCPGSV